MLLDPTVVLLELAKVVPYILQLQAVDLSVYVLVFHRLLWLQHLSQSPGLMSTAVAVVSALA